MPTIDPRLGLAKPIPSDDFDVDEIAANWQKVANHPGIFICTSTTRPAWATAHQGMQIHETDTDLYWRWTGSTFVRTHAVGLLGMDRRYTDLGLTGGTPTVIVQQTVSVPPGDRPIRVTATWPKVTGGEATLEIRRGSTTLQHWGVVDGQGGSVSFIDTEAPSGSVTYDFRGANDTDPVTISALGGDSPASIDVCEI